MTLLEAAQEFEKILPGSQQNQAVASGQTGGVFSLFAHAEFIPVGLNTWKDAAFGDLHRVYWDETDRGLEDVRLVQALVPFIGKSEVVVHEDMDCVIELRECLRLIQGEMRKRRFRSIDSEWDWV